jgi:hypothetical protein
MRVVLAVAEPEVPVQRPSEPVELVLDWQAVEGCPARPALLDDLRAMLPDLPVDVPSSGTAALRVSARVEPSGEAWQVELELVTPAGAGTRRFSASTCDEAARATVLVVAVAIDPVAASTSLGVVSSTAPPVDSSSPPAQPEPEPERGLVLEPSESRRGDASTPDVPRALRPARAPRVGLRLHGGASWGPTRAVHGALGGALALFDRRWRWELAAGWSTPRVQRFADGRGASFDGWMISSRGCFVPAPGRIELPICAGIEAGQVRGRGIAPTTQIETRRVPWVAPLLGAGLAWAPIERLAIGIELGLVVPLTRASFVIGEQELQRMPALGGRVLAGLELRLP